MRTAVVGGGAAGSVVARGLADAGDDVVVFEAGPTTPPEPRLDWLPGLADGGRLVPGLSVVRVPNGPTEPYRQGFGLGGGSAVNGMVLDEPAADDPMWGPLGRREVTDARARVADRVAGWTPPPGPLGAALLGGELPDDWRARSARLAAAAGRRLDAAEAWGIREHPGIEVRGDDAVVRLDTEPDGLVVRTGRGPSHGFERIVVCAGAIGSPLLLAASGVGARFDGLSDHPSVPLTIELKASARVAGDVDAPPATTLVDLTLDADDGEPGRAHLYVMDHLGDGEGRRLGLVQLALLDARSTGTVGRREDGGAEVAFDLLADAADRRALRRALREVVAVLDPSSDASPLRGIATSLLADDRGTPAVFLGDLDDGDLDAWLLRHLGAHAHASASLGLGRVLGDDGAVPGMRGVHVVDSSAFAALPGCNPQLAVLVLAEALTERLLAA